MSFTDEYLELKKKKKKNESKTTAAKTGDSFTDEYLSKREKSHALGREVVEDIAPVRTTAPKTQAEERERTWFKSGAFDDGYQFGDVAKTILGTVGDIGVGAIKGIGYTAEGVSDLVSYGVAGVADLVGRDAYAEDVRERTRESVTDRILGGIEKKVDKYSVLGDKSDSIAQGIGQVATIIATGGLSAAAGAGTIGTTVATTGMMGVSSMGSGMSEAYEAGATDEEAATYGLIKGIVDAGSEMIFGGLGKAVKAVGLSKGLTSVDDMLAKKLSSKITNHIAKNFVEYGVKASAEGLEEVIAGVGSAMAKQATYMSEKDLDELLKDENLMEQFVAGAVTSGIAQSGIVPGMKSGSLMEANQTGRDFVSGMTENEQKVIDKVVKDRIAEEEKNGKLSNKDKNKIYDDVVSEMEKGFIPTDTIEEVLGGESYKSYKDTVDSEDALAKEFEELGNKTNATLAEQSRYAELKAKLDDIKQNSQRSQLKSKLSEDVMSLVKGDRLAESYNERARRGQAFEADLTQYDAKQQETIKKAVESGILNNTGRTHEFVDLLAKISADKGVPFDFTNNEKLKASSFAVDGKTVNGFVTKDGITLNIDSAKALNSVVGHEITHVLEGTEAYTALQSVIVEYAKTKGEYQSRYDSLAETYKNIEGADIDAELTADLVGDYLFTDPDFIHNLSTQNRNVFQKIYDEIKYLCKVATAGSKEARELEKVKRAFEKAYKEGGRAQTDAKYSVSDADQMESSLNALKQERAELEDQLDMAYLNDLSDAEVRKLNNRLTKVNADIDKIVAEERRASVRTPMQTILDNLGNYRRSDLESLAEQISDSAWDGYEDLSRSELEDALREAINERELSPLEMQSKKFGLYVRPAEKTKYSLASEFASGEGGEKYWRPKIGKQEWDLINYRKNQEFDDPTFDIDENEKWLYAKQKGVTVFALYSKNDPDDPTVLYAAKGKNAEKKYAKLQMFVEDKKNEAYRNRTDVARLDELLSAKRRAAAENLSDDGDRGTDVGHDGVHVGKQDRNSGGADVQSGTDYGRTEVTEHPIRASEESDAFSLPSYSLSNSDVNQRSYAEIMEEQTKLHQRDMSLIERKREANNNPELLQALDDYSNLFTELRSLLPKKRTGTATQAELDRIEEIKVLRDEQMNRISELNESLGINAIAEEEREIRELRESLRVAADEAWAREGAEKENKAIEKSGLSAPEYFRKEALKAFKTTTNFNEAGYMLPDGKLLNFSGGERNHRYRDHREIGEIYEATQGTAALNRFLSDGNIRIMAESPGIDLASGVEPTKEQYAALRKFINSHGTKEGQFFVDFSGTGGNRVGNYSYEGRVNADRVLNDIKYYYANGEIRQQSEIGRFLSLSKRGEQFAPVSNFDTFGKDIALETAEEAPVAESATTTEEAMFPDNYAPEEDIAPVVAERVVTPRVAETYEAIRPKREKQPRLARATPEEQARADVLVEEPKVDKKKSNLWSMVKNNVLDKGMVFEDLSLKTGNRELQARWNTIRYADGKAQQFMEKNLKPIIQTVEKSGKTGKFYEYLYHMHNADRMTLADRYEDMENKPVFGSAVTAKVSQDAATRLERENPEFKQWAQDIYNYNRQNRELLVEGGVISREVANLWEEMYPHYVPIRRVGDEGLNINVPLDTGRTGVNAPIKRATGGNRDILPLFDTMGQRTMQTYKAIAKNRFGVELKNTLGTTIENDVVGLDEAIDSVDAHDELLQEGKNGHKPTFTVFENGEKVTFEITDEMYDAMKPKSKGMAYTNKALNVANNIRRGLLTEYNPAFMFTNPIKDTQDVLMNSQHPARTYANYPRAVAQLIGKNGHWYQEYMDNGGEQNTYFESDTNTFAKEKSAIRKIVGFPLDKISEVNNFIERVPRMAEYIASRKAGASIDVAMLDAARVTTNFAAGGDLTKLLNRNGVTFLNASVQGAMQQVRNVREAKANGLKGFMTLAAKMTAAGLPAMLLNHLVWDDDEEYAELSDYVKQNYYIVGKYDDGKFVRIPKGRALAVIQNGFEQMENLVTGNDEADLATFGELLISNLAPNNPLDNNIFAPIAQALRNETWYGDDLVPTRLQDLPVADQYDETTDEISKWLGEKLDVSPYKLNYLLDQYSGGIGDTFLPYITPEAERGKNSLLAPLSDKFTTDSVLKNQNISDFYDTKDELAMNAKMVGATNEDILKSKYMNSVNAELSELYAEKREIQNSDMSDEEKYEAVRDIQSQIVELTRESLYAYENVSVYDEYATVADRHYRKNKDGEWQKITDDQLEKQEEVTSGLGISASDYWSNKEEYDFAYEKPEKYAIAKSVGGYDAYKSYSGELYDIKADKDENGKSISGSRKEKVLDYINGLDIDYGERLILFKNEYNADDTYNYEIIDYLDSREDISWDEMKTILKELGFTVSSDGRISWD